MRYVSSKADWFPSEGLSNPTVDGRVTGFYSLKWVLESHQVGAVLTTIPFFLCSQWRLGRWLRGSPEASGQQLWWWSWCCWASQRLRAETLHVSAGHLLPEPELWGTGSEEPLGWSVEGSVISEYSLLSQVSSLWGRQLCYVLISTSKDEDIPHPMGSIHPGDVIMGSRKRSVHLLPLTGQSDIWVIFENKNILKIRK